MAGAGVKVRFPPPNASVGLAPTLLVYKHFADGSMGRLAPPHGCLPWGWGTGGGSPGWWMGVGSHGVRVLLPSPVAKMANEVDLAAFFWLAGSSRASQQLSGSSFSLEEA